MYKPKFVKYLGEVYAVMAHRKGAVYIHLESGSRWVPLDQVEAVDE